VYFVYFCHPLEASLLYYAIPGGNLPKSCTVDAGQIMYPVG
jgi:hypothetical protein